MLQTLPEFRSKGKIKHGQAETLTLFIIGTLVGKKSLRRIQRWCIRQIENLRKYMPLTNGIPSVPTFSRILAGTDEEMLTLTFTTWVEEIFNCKGRHIAIDGKGLRGAAYKIRDERTPYILNAIDVENKLVTGQMGIPEKANEMTAIPEFIEILETEGNVVTIDAIGTTGRIMNTIRQMGGHFMLQVKKNNPVLYEEIIDLFHGLKEEKKADPERKGKCSAAAEGRI